MTLAPPHPQPHSFGTTQNGIYLSNSCNRAGGSRGFASLPSSRPAYGGVTNMSSSSTSDSSGERKRGRTSSDSATADAEHLKIRRQNLSRNSDRSSIAAPLTPRTSPPRSTSAAGGGSEGRPVAKGDGGEDAYMQPRLSTATQEALGLCSADVGRMTLGQRSSSYMGGYRGKGAAMTPLAGAFSDRDVHVREEVATALQCAPVIPRHPSPETGTRSFGDSAGNANDTAEQRWAQRASMPAPGSGTGAVRREAPRPSAYAAFRSSAADVMAEDMGMDRRRASMASMQDVRTQQRPETSHVTYPSLKDQLRSPTERMVAVTCVAIESIWKCPPSTEPAESTSRKPIYPPEQHLPLDDFVRETVRRSRTPIAVHQLALVYLHRCRHKIHERVLDIRRSADELQRLLSRARDAAAFDNGVMTPPSSPPRTREGALLWRTINDPIGDGRKMFLSALMCAWKFAQDSNYSNKAWSKITGLDVSKVSENERKFLDIIDFNLNVTPQYLDTWVARLDKLAQDIVARESSTSPVSPDEGHAVEQPIRRGSLGVRTASEYAPAPKTTETRVGGTASKPIHIPLSSHKAGTEPTLGMSRFTALPSPDSSPVELEAERQRERDMLARERLRAQAELGSSANRRGAMSGASVQRGRTISSGSFPLTRTLSQGFAHGGFAHSALHHGFGHGHAGVPQWAT